MNLLDCDTINRNDIRDNPAFASNRPPAVGHESSLHQFVGHDVFIWFHRTLKSPIWYPYGEPMVIEKERTK